MPYDPIQCLSPLFGQDDGNRGNIVDLIFPGDVVDVVELKSTNANGQLMNVCLSLRSNGDKGDIEKLIVDDFMYLSIKALIEWGSGNSWHQAECDFINGTQLSLGAENIKVRAAYCLETVPDQQLIVGKKFPAYKLAASLNEQVNFPEFSVSASFNYGGSSGRNSNQARFTKLAQITAPNGTTLIQIPDFAVSLSVLPVDDATLSFKMFGYGKKYAVNYVVGTPLTNVGQHNTESALPIFNGAKFIEVKNASPGAMAAFFVFGLAL